MQEFWNWFVSVLREVGLKLVAALIVFAIGRILIKAVVKQFRTGKLSKKLEPTVSQFLANFVKVVMYVLLAVTLIGIMGVPMASVIAAIASAGVAIGLALQGSLSNLAGGIMILLFRPFRVDHFVDAGGFTGTVKDIDIFYTVINTPDNKVVTIPNGAVMSSPIINYSINDTRRVDLVFSAAYGTDAQKVIDVILDEASKHEMVLADPAPFCRLSAQSASSLDFTLRAWTEKENFWKVHFDLLEAVHNRFVAEGIEIPFNQLDVHVKSN